MGDNTLNIKYNKMDKLTVTIKGKEFEVEQEVFDLIHSISLERDKAIKNQVGLTNSKGDLFLWGEKGYIFMRDGCKGGFDLGFIIIDGNDKESEMNESKHQSMPYKTEIECLTEYLKYEAFL